MLKPIRGVSVSADAADEDWGSFDYGCCTHDFFSKIRRAFSVFYGEDVGHACFVTCEA